MKVTVLIAVYNTEKYLRQCLDSLSCQSMTDFEALCVDDCSTDGSSAILEEYAAGDSRFKIFHLSDNHGQAYARNYALKYAKGEYVCFLDSDDFLSPDALQSAISIYNQYPNTDSVLFHVKLQYPNHSESYQMKDFDVLNGRDAFVQSLTWKIHGVYITRTSINKKYPYDESSHAYSDDNITRLHYFVSHEVRLCSGIYYYRQHSDSVTHKIDVHRFDYMRANDSMARVLRNLKVEKNLINIYENVRWVVMVDSYQFYFLHHKELSLEDAKYGLNEIRRVWSSIDTSVLKPRYSCKLGYIPFRSSHHTYKISWTLFRIQEYIYFTLKKFKSKLSCYIERHRP